MLAVVDFVSLETFEKASPGADTAAISIGDPGDPLPHGWGRWPRKLRLQFLDLTLEEARANGIRKSLVCSPAHARTVVEFLQALACAPENWRLLVHCTLGSSRSAAVALAARQLSNCHFPREAEAWGANPYVLTLLSDCLGEALIRPARPAEDYRWKPDSPLI